MEPLALQHIRALCPTKPNIKILTVRVKSKSTSHRISPMTRESSEEVPMLPWLFQPAPTRTSYSKPTSANTTQNAWNNNGQKQLKNSLPVMLKRLKLLQANRTLIFRLTSSFQSSLIRPQSTKLDAKQSTRSWDHRHHTRCQLSKAFQKRLSLKITSSSSTRRKLSQSYLCSAGRHSN